MIRKLTVTVNEDGKMSLEIEGGTLVDVLGLAEYAVAVARYDLLRGVDAAIAIVERERLDEAKVWLKEFAAICDEEGMDATAIQVRKALTDLEKGGARRPHLPR